MLSVKVAVDAAAEARKAAFERIFRAEAAAAIARTPASVFIATSSSPSGEPRREPNAAEAAAAKAAFILMMDVATDAVFREMPASSFSLARFAGRPVSEAIETAKAQFKQIFDAASADAIAKIPAITFIAAPLREATDPAEAEAAKQAFKRIYDEATAASLEGIPDSAFFSAPWTAPGVLEAGIKKSFADSLDAATAAANQEALDGVFVKSQGVGASSFGNAQQAAEAEGLARKQAFEQIFRAEAAAAIDRTPANVLIATSSPGRGGARKVPDAAEADAAKDAFKQIMDTATVAVFKEMPASSFSLARFAGRPVSEAIEATKAQFKQIFDAASADAIAKIPATTFIAAPLREATNPAEAEAAKQAFKRIYDAATAASLEGIPYSAFFSAPWTVPGLLEAGIKESFDGSWEGGKAAASEEETNGTWVKARRGRSQY